MRSAGDVNRWFEEGVHSFDLVEVSMLHGVLVGGWCEPIPVEVGGEAVLRKVTLVPCKGFTSYFLDGPEGLMFVYEVASKRYRDFSELVADGAYYAIG